MIKVTLRPDWKEQFNEEVGKFVMVEMSQGKIDGVFVSHEELIDVKVGVINHDLLRLRLPMAVVKHGLPYNPKLYDQIVEIMKMSGDDDVESVISSIVGIKK